MPNANIYRTTHQTIPSDFGSNSSHSFNWLPAAESPPIQRERFTLFPPYKTREHAFGNYWTFQGGLVELVGVLPSRQQADVLVGIYFDCVDPLYPIINRTEFIAEYVSCLTLSSIETINTLTVATPERNDFGTCHWKRNAKVTQLISHCVS